jgi:uncharacterized damage-inducible protein DinB
MRTLVKNFAIVFAVALLIQTTRAQDAPKTSPAPKAADSPSKVLLDNWNDIGRKLTAMAEDFPEDKYDFKPNPVQRSFAEQLLHVSVNLYFFIEAAKGAKPPSDIKRADFATKAAVVDYVKKSFADGAALIKSKGDRGMSDLFADPFSNRQTRFSDGAWGFIEHSGEHYGQLVVYYRTAGLVPPESRPKK